MRHRLHLTALVAMSLIGATTSVFAQGTGPAAGAQIGTAPGTDGVPLIGTTPTNPGAGHLVRSRQPADHDHRHRIRHRL